MSDNHHVTMSATRMSCGIAELSGLSSDPEKVLYAMATTLYHPSRGSPYACVMWSDTEDSNGEKLFLFLEEKFDRGEEYGSDVEGDFPMRSGYVENPKTSNKIALYYWWIPHERFKAWYVEQRVAKAKKL
jgi:hypothetical protein